MKKNSGEIHLAPPALMKLFFHGVDETGSPIYVPSGAKVAYGGRGSAKCLARGTKVIMFNGELKAVEDIAIGDQVMGPDSKPRNVLSVTSGIGPLYKVSQTSGIDYIVNDAHILSTKKSKSCKLDRGELSKAGNYRRPNGRYPNYPDIYNVNVQEYHEKSQRFQDNFRGYKAGLIQFPEQDVILDPYFLGLWLGDGDANSQGITTADPEIVDFLEKFAEENFLKLSKYSKSPKSAASKYNISNKSIGRIDNKILCYLRALNLIGNKHIPQSYISNSEDIRLKLLAGLIDSDGHFDGRGTYSITQKKESLAKKIKYLADTLGFRTSFTQTINGCQTGAAGVYFRVGISGDINRVPCLLPRKKCHELKPNKDKMLSYLSTEAIGDGEYFGFSLDGDHLFCLSDGTVTHNSQSFGGMVVLMMHLRGSRVICTRETQTSISESVHALLESKIEEFGLQSQFDIFKGEIRHKYNGARCTYAGIRTDPDKIKSSHDIDIIWIEEASSVSLESMVKLKPTLRKDGAELWVTFNPENETDPVYRDYVQEDDPYGEVITRDNARIIYINYDLNPWFPKVLEDQRAAMQRTDPDLYDHVWGGKVLSISNAQVFYKKVFTDTFVVPDGCMGPYYGADWGFSTDPTVLTRSWITPDNRLLIDYDAYEYNVELDNIPALFDTVPRSREYIIRADNSRPETISKVAAAGFRCIAADKWKGSVEDGIAYIRSFDSVVVHERAPNTFRDFRLYRHKKDKQTGDVLPDLVDKDNHGPDSCRYGLDPYIQRRNPMNYFRLMAS